MKLVMKILESAAMGILAPAPAFVWLKLLDVRGHSDIAYKAFLPIAAAGGAACFGSYWGLDSLGFRLWVSLVAYVGIFVVGLLVVIAIPASRER